MNVNLSGQANSVSLNAQRFSQRSGLVCPYQFMEPKMNKAGLNGKLNTTGAGFEIAQDCWWDFLRPQAIAEARAIGELPEASAP